MRSLPGLLTLLLLAAPAPGAQAALPTDLEAQVQAIVDQALAESATPGASVAVVAEGRIVAEVASGLADREAQVPATTETVYPAASLSKLVTAVLVMQQVERGKITLDSAVNQYLVPARWVRDAGGEPVSVTLRQLLSHTSGLPVAYERALAEPGESPLSLDAYLADGLELVRPPGEKIIYADEGFSLAGYLAARLEGKDFQGLARARLFAPLALVNSSFYPRFDLDQRLAGAHGDPFGGTEQHPQVNFTAMAPAGSLRTTVGDLARFALMCLAGGALDGVRVLRPESLRELWTVQARAHPELDEGFGLGFAVSERPGRRMVWWIGDLPGASSRLEILPDHGLAVAVLTNASDPSPVNAIAEAIFALLAGPPPPNAYSADPAALDDLAGEYRIYDVLDQTLWYLAPLSNLRLEPRDGALQARLLVGDPFARLEPVAPGRFRVDGGILHGRSVLFEDGRIFVGWMSGRRLSWFERSEALAAYAGLVALLVLFLLGTGLWRGLRRLRRKSS